MVLSTFATSYVLHAQAFSVLFDLPQWTGCANHAGSLHQNDQISHWLSQLSKYMTVARKKSSTMYQFSHYCLNNIHFQDTISQNRRFSDVCSGYRSLHDESFLRKKNSFCAKMNLSSPYSLHRRLWNMQPSRNVLQQEWQLCSGCLQTSLLPCGPVYLPFTKPFFVQQMMSTNMDTKKCCSPCLEIWFSWRITVFLCKVWAKWSRVWSRIGMWSIPLC